MRPLALSSIAPLLGRRVPIRGPGRLLHSSYRKAELPSGVREAVIATKEGDRFHVDLASSLEWELWAFGSYETEVSLFLKSLLSPGDACIDVGANIGIHTVRMARLVGPDGLVVAVEADAGVSSRLEANVHLNDLRNVTILNAAASAVSGQEVSFYPTAERDRNKGRGSVLPHKYLSPSATSVPTVSLDDVADRQVRLVKIDVEGYEGSVISGATHLIERDRPAIIFEHNAMLESTGGIAPVDFLPNLGYRLFVIQGVRNWVTGRTSLGLSRMRELPAGNANLLAISDGDLSPDLWQADRTTN
jgi:FkbM family methyltransferase